MAFMNQERKALLAAELKKVVPADWKYTLSVRNHSTIVMTISQAPVDIIGESLRVQKQYADPSKALNGTARYMDVNGYYLDRQFDGDLLDTFTKIKAALNTGNWDKSDPMTDYFNVGWYVDINVGTWDKPFLDVLPRPDKVQAAPFTFKPTGAKAPDFDTYKAFLPDGWEKMTPGMKAAATKKAKAFAVLYS